MTVSPYVQFFTKHFKIKSAV